MSRIVVAVIVSGIAVPGLAIVPFNEPFSSSANNWRQSDGLTDLSWNSNGALDGTSFASAPFNFVNQTANATPILFRGSTLYNTSGNLLFGDWRTDPVTEVLADVRQNSGVPLTFFSRFSPGAAGAVALSAATVPSGEWQQVRFTILPFNPQTFFYEGPGVTYDTVFTSVARVQFGVLVPQELAGLDQGFQFDLDNIRIVPTPGGLALLALASLCGHRRRR